MRHLALTAQVIELKNRIPAGWDDMNLPVFRTTTIRRIVVCRSHECKEAARQQLGRRPEPGVDPYANPGRGWSGSQIFNTALRREDKVCGVCGAAVQP